MLVGLVKLLGGAVVHHSVYVSSLDNIMKWSFLFSFTAVICLNLGNRANSDILYNGGTSNLRPPGTVATYTCVTGYRIVGTTSATMATRSCLTNGVWSGTAPTCECEIVTQLLSIV